MRLLIVTQAVDIQDPILGFFHRWIEEIAKNCEQVHVICLKEGSHTLPKNVQVHSLGKEGGRSRVKYVRRFYSYIWNLRHEYDAVLVHMNQEYVLLGGLLWRLAGKRVVLWRNHKIGSLWTNIACAIAHAVCYTSEAAYVAHAKNGIRMPIGIDTETFIPRWTAPTGSILFLGRLDPVKNVHVFVAALTHLYEMGQTFVAALYGSPTDPKSKYAHDVRNQAAVLALEGVLSVHEAVLNSEAARLYAEHAIYVNLTPSGSFDKTIGEAMAAGAIVVAMNDAIRSVVPEEIFVQDESVESTTRALKAALSLSPESRARIIDVSRKYIHEQHSLARLMQTLLPLLH
jgi:glycosyltransferase involved in cell wall biosynthesis